MSYYRLSNSDTWHFMINCSKFLKFTRVTRRKTGIELKFKDLNRTITAYTVKGRPKSGELCNECRAKEKRSLSKR